MKYIVKIIEPLLLIFCIINWILGKLVKENKLVLWDVGQVIAITFR